MKTWTKIFYAICFGLFMILLLISACHPNVEESIFRSNNSFEMVTDYELTTFLDETAPIGIAQEYKWNLQNIPDYNGCVTFYLVHQESDIYIDDELVYQLKTAEDDHLSKTPGYEWAEIYLTPADNGHTLRIYIYPAYESSVSTELEIYFGDVNAIRDHLMRQNLPVMLIAALAIILGCVFVIFYFINIKNKALDRSILMLGVFSIAAGLWKICDMTSAPIIFSNSFVLSVIAIFSITLMVVPFSSFIQVQLNQENSPIWDIVSILCCLASCCIILLQLCGIADLRETLICSHIMIAFMVIFIMIHMILEIRRKKLTSKLKLTLGCCLLCTIGVIVDMGVYYYSGNSGSMIYCLLAFLIYATIMGIMSAHETRRLIDRGHQAEHYQNLAMHDPLTGLYNRAFYSEFVKTHNVHRENCFIIMLDVNDLKLCNDTMGHDWGDQLLINSAQIIKKAFPIGECIRMGGDEFCVLLYESSEAECQLCLNTFDDLLEQFNLANPKAFPISIAYGYANYLSKVDFDFSDTLRRADKKMYQFKLDMKSFASKTLA